MENYDIITVAGEGSYGIVMKCRHKVTKKVVAIKKLIDIEGDRYAKKMALREIRILRKLQHENLVKLLEVFRKKKRFYLVFEYLDRTVLDDLEDNPSGLGEKRTREYMNQLLRGIEYCHSKNVIHRDIKPENLLVSKCGILKLCDFGFARILNSSNGMCTEYIATRWYRAPELLVKDRHYGRPIDIWAIGCVFAELLNGEPLFPGDSDVDQLFQITKLFGKLCTRHQQLLYTFHKSRELGDVQIENNETETMNNVHALHVSFPTWSTLCLNIIAICLELDPDKRPSATELLNYEYFDRCNFRDSFRPSILIKRKTTAQKSSITSELDPDHCNHSNLSSQISNSNFQKTPSPSEKFGSSSSMLKFNTFCKRPPITADANNANSFLNIHKMMPFKMEHLYSNNRCRNINTSKPSPFSLRWPEFVPNLNFENVAQESQSWRDSKKEEIKELPVHNPQITQCKKITNAKQKSKLFKITDADLNLPYLHHVIESAKMKSKSVPFLIESIDKS